MAQRRRLYGLTRALFVSNRASSPWDFRFPQNFSSVEKTKKSFGNQHIFLLMLGHRKSLLTRRLSLHVALSKVRERPNSRNQSFFQLICYAYMTAIGRTWIVVLDDSGARFLRRESSGKWTQAAPGISSPAAEAFTPESRRATREQFARKVMSAVDTACDGNQCDSIVTIGPERLLRSFRNAATDRVRVRLWRERAADTSSMTDSEIAKLVERYFRESNR